MASRPKPLPRAGGGSDGAPGDGPGPGPGDGDDDDLRARLWFLDQADAFARRFALAEVLGAPRARRPWRAPQQAARAALGPRGRTPTR